MSSVSVYCLSFPYGSCQSKPCRLPTRMRCALNAANRTASINWLFFLLWNAMQTLYPLPCLAAEWTLVCRWTRLPWTDFLPLFYARMRLLFLPNFHVLLHRLFWFIPVLGYFAHTKFSEIKRMWIGFKLFVFYDYHYFTSCYFDQHWRWARTATIRLFKPKDQRMEYGIKTQA